MIKKTFILGIGFALAFGLCIGMTGCGEKAPYDGLKLDDYIKVGQYKGLEVEKPTIKVSKDDVQAKIDEALEAASESKSLGKDDEIKKGDTVNIDYVG